MKQNPFIQRKAAILKSINENSPDSPDFSPKGTIDALCLPIIHLINSCPHMVTTSTCSGRVSVFLEGSKLKHSAPEDDAYLPLPSTKAGGKGEGGRWLFITHEVENLDNWYTNLFNSEFENTQFDYIQNSEQIAKASSNPATRYVLFKFEPLILHVFCANYETACELYATAMACGFRESGIGKNNNVAIRISIRLDVPIGFLDEALSIQKGTEKVHIFIQEPVLNLITNLSRDKFAQNLKKLQELHQSIEKMINSLQRKTSEENKLETKEERRQRKMAEGLARREAVRELKQIEKLNKLKIAEEQNSFSNNIQ